MKKKALNYEGEHSSDFLSYKKSQSRFAKREFSISNIESLLKSISSTRITFLGDFHTFDQNSRNLERIMRVLGQKKNKFHIGVEFVFQHQQAEIDAFLKGEITEIEFLDSIDYHESWRFPWSHYRPFFELARKNNLKILALNTIGTLTKRDESAAQKIKQFLKENPKEKMLVLFGELHIVKNKLPKLCSSKQYKFTTTIIHQNLDEVYWSLIEQGNSKLNTIVKFNDNEYSLQTSPPWIKYESMIYWYENLLEDPDFDIHDYIMNTGLFSINSAVQDNFLFLCRKIESALHISASDDSLEDFNLYDHNKLNIILEKVSRIPVTPVSNFYKRLVEEGRVFRVPFSTNLYCSSYSINRISFLAGLHIQDIFMRGYNIHYEKVLLTNNQVEKFVYLLHQTMMGYLSSKIINPFRKCNLYLDLRKKYMSSKTNKQEKETLKTIINIIEWDGTIGLDQILKGKSLFQLYLIERPIAFYLSDILYDKLFSQNKKSFGKIIEWLLSDDFTENDFFDVLRKLLPENEFRKHKKREF